MIYILDVYINKTKVKEYFGIAPRKTSLFSLDFEFFLCYTYMVQKKRQ